MQQHLLLSPPKVGRDDIRTCMKRLAQGLAQSNEPEMCLVVNTYRKMYSSHIIGPQRSLNLKLQWTSLAGAFLILSNNFLIFLIRIKKSQHPLQGHDERSTLKNGWELANLTAFERKQSILKYISNFCAIALALLSLICSFPSHSISDLVQVLHS